MSSQVSDAVPTLYDVRQVAAALGVSTKTVERMYKSGVLPHIRLGKRVQFTEADLIDAIMRARVDGR